jgi:hypothetical protein
MGGEFAMWKTRLCGAAAASAIAAVVALLLTVIGGDESPPALAESWADTLVPACLAGLLLATRVHADWRRNTGDVLAMAVVTYLIGVLLFPMVQAVAAWPAVSNGGQVPCLNLRPGAAMYEGCASGLHGSAAWEALVRATIGYYELTPVALVVCSPLIVLVAVPSLAWVVAMRWCERFVYQRSR